MSEKCKFPGMQGEFCRTSKECLLLEKLKGVKDIKEELVLSELNSIEADSNRGCVCGSKVREKILQYIRSRNPQQPPHSN